MSLNKKFGIEDDFLDWISTERVKKQKVLASRWALKQQFKYREDVQALESAIDSLTEDELEWLARDVPESYSDCQRRADFFEHRALLLRSNGRCEDVE